MRFQTPSRLLLAVLAVSLPLSTPSLSPAQPSQTTDTRIVVKTQDDLPRHTYKVKGTALEIIRDDVQSRALISAALKDALDDLNKYKIQDTTTLKAYYDNISLAYYLTGDLNQALVYTDKSRELETKEQEKLMRGLGLRARIAAKNAAGADESKFRDVFRSELKKSVSALPYPIIKDQLIAVRAQAKIITAQLVESSISNSLDPLITANDGTIPTEVVIALGRGRQTLELLPLIPIMAEVYGEIIDANAAAPAAADLWTPRLVTLDPSTNATPVVVAVWDSGVDTSLYSQNLWTNPAEKPNGKDDDNNGFVDDLHGIAFSEKSKPTAGPLADLSGLKGDKAQLMGFIAAAQDMQAGLTTPEVQAFQNFYKSLEGQKLKDFTQDLGLLGGYVHGTHVAGIVVAGNPFARILHITENWPYKDVPDTAPTVEDGLASGNASKQAVAYLKNANARVVNMSWRIGRSAYEGMLAAKGAGATPEERAEISRQIFAGFRSGLEDAIRSAPDVLFIAGSGNEDNDVDFAEYIPAGLRLPNLLTVGAIDDQDKFTSFTSTGKNVHLYANGYRIESNLPGGQRVKFSGTSMSAPQVANLAAKILALKPELKPAEVIALIEKNADPIPNQPGRFIINPKRTLAALAK